MVLQTSRNRNFLQHINSLNAAPNLVPPTLDWGSSVFLISVLFRSGAREARQGRLSSLDLQKNAP